MWARLRSTIRALVGRQDLEAGMREEVRFHLAQYTADLVRSGVPEDEAARQARLEFGNIDNVKDDCREARGLRVVEDLRRTVGHAMRVLHKRPGLTFTALGTLALCLGANLTIFGVVDSILLRPLPFPDAGRLVRVFNTYPRAGVTDDGASITNYYERRGALDPFSSLAEYREGHATLGDTGSTERAAIMRVSPQFFATLGVAPVAGREFADADMTPETDRVAVITDGYWRQHFDADPQVVGRSVRVNGLPTVVVGLLPPTYRFLSSRASVYLPLSSSLEQRGPDRRHNGNSIHMVARLTEAATIEEAESALAAHNAAVGGDSPETRFMADAGFRTVVVSLHDDHVAAARPVLLLVQAAALFLLLIGAGNLINLLLIRASERAKEFAVRQALGASRMRIASEVMVETTVLTLIGGVLGLGVGGIGTRLLAVLGASHLPLGAHIAFDARVAAVGVAVTVVVGIALGLPVAWHCSRQRPGERLHTLSRGTTTTRSAERLRHTFVLAQMSIAFVLLSGTGLLALSLSRASAVSPGFQADNILSGQLSLSAKDYPDGPSVLSFVDRLTRAVEQQPGVRAVGIATNVPLSGLNMMSAATGAGYVAAPGESPRGHYSYGVAGQYFEALGLASLEGRALTPADTRSSGRVAVVDEDFARHYWPDRSAVGQRAFQGGQPGDAGEAFIIVGVVGAVKQADVTSADALGAIYYPLTHRLDRDLFVVARTTVAPASLTSVVERVVRSVDPEMTVTDVLSMQARMTESLVTYRAPTLLVGLFTFFAVLLTAIGTYGVLSYAVGQRRREIGLRVALGARPGQIRGQFVYLAGRLLAGGLTLGVAGAWLAARSMQSMLFDVSALPWGILAGTSAVLMAVALAACFVPAYRASRLSPMEALANG